MLKLIRKIPFVAGLGIFMLSLVAMPFAAEAATEDTTISSAVAPVISLLTTSATVSADVTPTGAGAQTIASDTVTVSTNDSAGYTLKLALAVAAPAALTSGANTIPAIGGTQGVPIALTANTWGYRVDSIGAFGVGPTSGATNQAIASTTFAAVPATASPDTIETTATTASSDTTTVWYGVAVNTTKPSGTYTSTVLYTATTN